MVLLFLREIPLEQANTILSALANAQNVVIRLPLLLRINIPFQNRLILIQHMQNITTLFICGTIILVTMFVHAVLLFLKEVHQKGLKNTHLTLTANVINVVIKK